MAIVRIQLRRDTAADWTSADPILAEGEVGIETDTDLFKIGDGSTAWTSLGYGGLQGIVAATSPITYDGGTQTVGIDLSAISLTDLGNVVITSATTGELVQYDGTNWVNSTIALGDLSNVTITTPAAGEAITYNGSAWVNQPAVTDSKPDTFLLMGA